MNKRSQESWTDIRDINTEKTVEGKQQKRSNNASVHVYKLVRVGGIISVVFCGSELT